MWKLLKILEEYKEMLGQKINKEKTSLFFSKSAKDDMKEEIKNVLGVNEIRSYEKYLGLPSLVGRAKKQALIILRRECGGNYKGGRGSSFLKPVEKSLSKQLPKPFQLMPWVVSNYP